MTRGDPLGQAAGCSKAAARGKDDDESSDKTEHEANPFRLPELKAAIER